MAPGLALKILVNPYVKAVTAKHQISLNLLVAVAFRYSSAFVCSADSGAQLAAHERHSK